MEQILTLAGLNLMLRGLCGEQIKFTKIKIGNGPEQDKTAEDLANPLMDVEIATITREETYVTLSGTFKNAEVSDGFNIREIGVFAENPDSEGQEILYGLWYEPDDTKADYVPAAEDRVLETQLNVLVFVGEVENVTATLNESMTYVTVAALKKHEEDQDNPHKVTKKQVGLENVENKSISEQTPVFEDTETMSANQSGEKIGTVFAKVKRAIETLTAHLSADNPHGITTDKLGAAAKTHYHNANQINAGTLPALRGGTGVTTLEALAGKLSTWLVNKAGDTMTGDLTIRKSYPGVRLAPTADGSNSIVMDAINQAMLQSRNAASDTNRRGLLVRNSAKSAGIAGALVLMDVTDGAYKYYDILHAGNFAASSWQLIYTASPSVEIEAMSAGDHERYGTFLRVSDIEDIVCAGDYSELKLIVALAPTYIADSTSNTKGASADLAVGGRYGDVYGSCEDGGNFTLSGTLERILYRDYINNDGTRQFRTLESDSYYNFMPGASNTAQMAGLKTTRCAAVTAKATVKVYAR